MSEATQRAEVKPYLREDGTVCIPFDCDPQYHYWREGGQSLYATMAEFGASVEAFKTHGGKIERDDDLCRCEKKGSAVGEIFYCASCAYWWEVNVVESAHIE